MDSMVFDQIRLLIEESTERLLKQKQDTLFQLIEEVLSSDADKPNKLLWTQSILPALTHVGKLFRHKEIFIPHFLFVVRITILRILENFGIEPIYVKYPIAIGVVSGDLHACAKNVIRDTLRAAGFPVIDLGVDVAAATFVKSVVTRDVKIIALSCFLTRKLGGIKEVSELLKENNLRKQVKVIAGGAAVSKKGAKGHGADDYGDDAWEAVEKIRGLLKLKNESEIG